ncbi:hypothetical protein EGW08_020748 [Elysia chlorotica]|uniref:Uncharacterized protein n=1 Tax=Elysia chlorotica TaxID=188477 RepID=A0A433SQG2_ELYCH|nr:hypothetical protein EGW08_020748 [Elysia chlorotica]
MNAVTEILSEDCRCGLRRNRDKYDSDQDSNKYQSDDDDDDKGEERTIKERDDFDETDEDSKEQDAKTDVDLFDPNCQCKRINGNFEQKDGNFKDETDVILCDQNCQCERLSEKLKDKDEVFKGDAKNDVDLRDQNCQCEWPFEDIKETMFKSPLLASLDTLNDDAENNSLDHVYAIVNSTNQKDTGSDIVNGAVKSEINVISSGDVNDLDDDNQETRLYGNSERDVSDGVNVNEDNVSSVDTSSINVSKETALDVSEDLCYYYDYGYLDNTQYQFDKSPEKTQHASEEIVQMFKSSNTVRTELQKQDEYLNRCYLPTTIIPDEYYNPISQLEQSTERSLFICEEKYGEYLEPKQRGDDNDPDDDAYEQPIETKSVNEKEITNTENVFEEVSSHSKFPQTSSWLIQNESQSVDTSNIPFKHLPTQSSNPLTQMNVLHTQYTKKNTQTALYDSEINHKPLMLELSEADGDDKGSYFSNISSLYKQGVGSAKLVEMYEQYSDDEDPDLSYTYPSNVHYNSDGTILPLVWPSIAENKTGHQIGLRVEKDNPCIKRDQQTETDYLEPFNGIGGTDGIYRNTESSKQEHNKLVAEKSAMEKKLYSTNEENEEMFNELHQRHNQEIERYKQIIENLKTENDMKLTKQSEEHEKHISQLYNEFEAEIRSTRLLKQE